MGESVNALAFGEVLWDVIEGVPHIGGAPFNFAAHQATPRAFYFGTLVQRSAVSARTLETLLDRFSDALVFFDVNLRQSYWSAELVEKGIGRSNVLKVNDEEMARLKLNSKDLFERHPRLEVVIETRGAAGCAVWSRTGESIVSPAVPDGPVVDTVGAGDSFSAAFLSALLGGKTLDEAAVAGNVRAGRVAARAGAIPEGF